MAERQKNIQILIEREKAVKEKVERHLQKLEDDRLNFQNMNKEKCK